MSCSNAHDLTQILALLTPRPLGVSCSHCGSWAGNASAHVLDVVINGTRAGAAFQQWYDGEVPQSQRWAQPVEGHTFWHFVDLPPDLDAEPPESLRLLSP